ncbi:MAG: PDZ domain-containing protein, partial [Steroidobacteraceae bacterium]
IRGNVGVGEPMIAQRRFHMTPHIRHRPTLLALCLSLAATAAFAGDGATAPATLATPPAPAAPVTPAAAPAPADAPAAPSPSDVDEGAWQARVQVEERHAEEMARRQEAAAESRMSAAERRANEEARQREDALRGQMDAARHRLEVAAQQLAALSAQMYGPMAKRFAAFGGPPRALIGVQLDDSSGHAGARVREVSPGGAAEQAGVRSGDLIVAVNGTDVRGRESAGRVVELLNDVKPGNKVDLKVLRDGKTQDFTVTARPGRNDLFVGLNLPDILPLPRVRAIGQWPGPIIIGGPVADMELAPLSPGLGRYFGTDSGVLVVRAPPQKGLGLQDGDVILSIGDRKPTDSSHVIRILSSYDPGEKITLEVMRMHRRISVATTVPAEPSLRRLPLILHKGDVLEPGPVAKLKVDDGQAF